MLYRRNLPMWERVARVLGAVVLAALAYYFGRTTWGYICGVSALIPILTGLFGYCPVCHIGGRKPLESL